MAERKLLRPPLFAKVSQLLIFSTFCLHFPLFPQGEDSVEYFLGLTPSGIVVLRNKTTVAHYYWPRIAKVYYKGRYFMLRISDKNVNSQTHPTRQWELELENCKLLAGNPKRQWPL